MVLPALFGPPDYLARGILEEGGAGAREAADGNYRGLQISRSGVLGAGGLLIEDEGGQGRTYGGEATGGASSFRLRFSSSPRRSIVGSCWIRVLLE